MTSDNARLIEQMRRDVESSAKRPDHKKRFMPALHLRPAGSKGDGDA